VRDRPCKVFMYPTSLIDASDGSKTQDCYQSSQAGHTEILYRDFMACSDYKLRTPITAIYFDFFSPYVITIFNMIKSADDVGRQLIK